jgi:hypothetical protein
MRALLIVSMLTLAFAGCQLAKSQVHITSAAKPDLAPAKKPDFDVDIKPIFQSRCQPCHFPGGQVYQKLPFDKPETITRLGTKLFTRIKDEKERALIREFLDQK